MQERLNDEIRRREKVIRIFPNEESAMRLIGAMLAEKHESWSTGRLYFDMTEFKEWQEERQKVRFKRCGVSDEKSEPSGE